MAFDIGRSIEEGDRWGTHRTPRDTLIIRNPTPGDAVGEENVHNLGDTINPDKHLTIRRRDWDAAGAFQEKLVGTDLAQANLGAVDEQVERYFR